MRRWHRVKWRELKEIHDYLNGRGINYNGCTQDELLRRYGAGNVKHISGSGWYVLRSTA